MANNEATELTDDEARLLVHRAGGTPVYVYSREALRAAARRVRAASVPGAAVYYSLKANPHPGVVAALAPLVDGFDVCSTAEMETALNAGTPPRDILFTGPAKSWAEAASALAAGIAVTVESPAQARLFAEVAGRLGVTGRAVVRLNTPYPGRTPDAAPSPNQFGIPDEDFAEVVEVLRGSPMALTGLHMFWGSQYSDAGVIRAARITALERARKLAERYGLAFELVSVGGGIAMPWCDRDAPVDWDGLRAVGEYPEVPGEGGPATVVCEYGRSLVGPAGSLLATVLDTKTVGDRRYVLVDAGMNHMMIASRLVAGAGRGEPSVRVVGARNPDELSPAYVTGPLCSQLDVLAENVLLPAVEVGDTLVFSGVGAYGPTFSPSGFLSRDKVGEIVH
ncbi:pyridoxal-dependent decarboxylase, exosortase A system-associated [Kitasatospora herbaricolor]|uniref:alanine racemase n=1 Tax=Kitasatospora herbaricolor TaxID=68217 RepID=UPI00174BC667|nr:alanine racemase [Kitasatospora herbaricolor]MDQ0309551.1 diaminopimelate decarboxylase [Kitasatospora herbaricolor]GGV01093.1 pyridoxal-dependent decarboxylase, exosortase A system-associated [Kitasatospora herbaricolor]